MTVVTASAVATALPGCIHGEAALVRDAKPITAGFLGAQVRPFSDVGVGVGVDAVSRLSGAAMEVEFESGGETVEGETGAFAVTAYGNVFPCESSHFFVGGGYTMVDARSRITVEGEDHLYGTKAGYLRPSFGWNWIWKSGFSLFLDVGVKIRITRGRDETGLATPAAREAARDFDDRWVAPAVGFGGGGSGLVGWSFGF